ncbi:MAG: EAL domain-containing protein [Rhodocyclales bacterium]|nr:EAL domain-containing protein [Rhodocyclales bacterium]
MTDDDLLEFADEAPPDWPAATTPSWKILIVDDDPDVHETTKLGFLGISICGRPLEFLHAYSAGEARAIFATKPDIAIILLDVVMETQHAGLQLVDEIRNRYDMKEARIILRTGQPGYAPEIDAIRDYDINDYKSKADLSRNRLYAALTSAIRTYQQIHVINAGREGLARIVRGSAALLYTDGLSEFASGVIVQMSGLLGLEPEGLVCARQVNGCAPMVIAAAGRFQGAVNQPLTALDDATIRRMLTSALEGEQHVIEAGRGVALHFGGRDDKRLAAYIDAEPDSESLDPSLLEVFCTNVSVCLDNTALVQRLKTYSYRDALLDLPNRRALVDRIDNWLHGTDAPHGWLAAIDIDHFGEINGALGHRLGDRLLQAAAQRLREYCADADCVARIGGDAFGVLWTSSTPEPERLRTAFAAPLEIDEHRMTLSSTTGVVCFADISGGGSEALEDALLALKQAKRAGRGAVVRYDPHMGAEIRDRVRLLSDLHDAFAQERLFLAYQPQIELATGRCVGAEALLRWRTADDLHIPPDSFIPLAEQSGLIVPLGEWVLRRACHEAVTLHAQGYNLRVAINVSLIQFRDPLFLDKLDAVVRETGVAPHRIELEITESVAMGEAARMTEMFGHIKAMGIEIAIDDFGTGFSSLAHLQRMNVDRLKIDRSFVSELGLPGKGGDIAGLVCGLGKRVGLELVAEGIETAEQATLLRGMGCQVGQGYLFAHPMAPEQWHAWLAEHCGGNAF